MPQQLTALWSLNGHVKAQALSFSHRQICDKEWHYYVINVEFPVVTLYVDGVTYDPYLVTDDWPIHPSQIDVQLTVGACWQGEWPQGVDDDDHDDEACCDRGGDDGDNDNCEHSTSETNVHNLRQNGVYLACCWLNITSLRDVSMFREYE